MTVFVFPAETLELFLKVLILRNGGEVVFTVDDSELDLAGEAVLFCGSSENGKAMTLSAVRILDSAAGHA